MSVDPATPTAARSTAIAPRPERAIVVDDGLFENLMDTSRFEHLQRVSKVFANSALVPEHFRGKEADCFIAVEMAMRLKLHPFNLMQSLYVVHGKPGIEAKMAIALINSSGIFEGPLQFKLAGTDMARQCTAFAVHAKTKQLCETTVTMSMAKAEGWIDKSGSKWKTLPDLMLQYRSASFFARLYCPEVIFGMQTREELEEIDVTPPGAEPPPERPQGLKDRIMGAVIDGATGRPEPVNEATATAKRGPGRPPKDPLAQPADPIRKAAQEGRSPTTQELVESGHIEIHDGEPTQDAAGATKPAEGVSSPQPTSPEAPAATGKGPAMPYESTFALAKKARTASQVEIVRDAMRGAGYTADEEANITAILNSKKLVEE